MEFLEQVRFEKVSVDADQSEHLIRLLDAVVIRLEGGTDYDLLALDEPRPAAGSVSGKVGDKPASGEDVKSESVKEEEEEDPKPFILGEE